MSAMLTSLALTFQSTLPVWGATGTSYGWQDVTEISIHAPRVGSDSAARLSLHGYNISIHAPRVGSDTVPELSGAATRFQSTLPVWGAT